MGIGSDIIALRRQNKSYREISDILKCNRSLIYYHCRKNNLTDIGLTNKIDIDINDLIAYYKGNTLKDTSLHFGISVSSIKRKLRNDSTINKRLCSLTPELRKQKNYQYTKNHRHKMKELAYEYKGKKCEKCGYNKSLWSLHFHHISDKDFNISSNYYKSWEKLKDELDKCILICANCHGELHEQEYIDKQ